MIERVKLAAYHLRVFCLRAIMVSLFISGVMALAGAFAGDFEVFIERKSSLDAGWWVSFGTIRGGVLVSYYSYKMPAGPPGFPRTEFGFRPVNTASWMGVGEQVPRPFFWRVVGWHAPLTGTDNLVRCVNLGLQPIVLICMFVVWLVVVLFRSGRPAVQRGFPVSAVATESDKHRRERGRAGFSE
jgi:hypothetical protein